MDLLPRQPVYAIIPASLPTLESSRLILRQITEDDIPAVFAIRSRPEVAKYNDPPEPFQSLEQTREWLSGKRYTAGPSDVLGRSFTFAVLDKSIDNTQERVIGYVSMNVVDPIPVVGYSFLPECWGKGYATEALRMMLKIWWDLSRRNVENGDYENDERVYAFCQRDNGASCGVLKKCGFEVLQEVVFQKIEVLLWALSKRADDRGDCMADYRYI